MPLFSPPLDIKSNGTDLGPVSTIDFTTGITVSEANAVATVSDIDTGGGDVTMVEIDFGTIPTRSKTFVVTDATITSSSHIMVTQSGTASTGRSADENEMDPITFSGTPQSGQFILIANTLNGPVVGKYRANYMVG